MRSKAPFPMKNLVNMVGRAKEKGVITKCMGMALEFAPPLIIRKTDIDDVIRVLDEVITEEEGTMGM